MAKRPVDGRSPVRLSPSSYLSAYVFSGLMTACKSVRLAERQIIFRHRMGVNWITLLNGVTQANIEFKVNIDPT